MSYTKGEWVADVHEYNSKPKRIITGIMVELSPNYYQRIFDTVLPESDKDYIKEHEEINANVKLACAAPDLLDALEAILAHYKMYIKPGDNNAFVVKAEKAINKAKS